MPGKSGAEIVIDTGSVDSNHAERDKHLRSKDFLDVARYPEARFVSSAYQEGADGQGSLKGELTLHGVTRPITITTQRLGAGPDPWGGHRQGFEGHARILLDAFAISYNVGPASKELELTVYVEGVKK